MADAAEDVAREADVYAYLLEQAAQRGDSARRLSVAAAEREISRIERRNAAKLRQSSVHPLELEPLPPLPGFES
jgi:hypothetical protein